MKKTIFTFLISFLWMFSFSQPPPLNISEQFDNNDWMWDEFDDGEIYAKVENGHYHLKNHYKDGTSRFYWKDFNIDETKNFIIEAKVRETSNAKNRLGLVWNATGWKNSNFLCISGNQFYVVSKYVDGKFSDAQEWKEDEKIVKPSGEYNLLSIQKIGSNLIFYVNNEKVYKTAYTPFIGRKIGFFLSNGVEAEIDYLNIYQFGDGNINLIDNPINGYRKENLGLQVNGTGSDRAPVIAPDGRTIYFIKEGYSFLTGSSEKSDVYYSQLGDDGVWTEAKAIGRPINNEGHNAVVGSSSDNQTLIVSNTYKEDGSVKSKGLSITNKNIDGWEVPKEIIIQNYKNNNKYADHCMSADNNVLLLAIETDDSRGDLDFYVSFRQEDGSYSEPVNMGDDINTKYQDGTIFLAADNKTIYFSSAGHPGYGSNDIFMSERLDETWLKWSKPKNLGPEINSASWDASFTVPANGDYAYMVSSDKNISKGKEDIIRIKLAESAKPQPVMLVKGQVLNAKTNLPISGSFIIYEDLESGKQLGTALSDQRDGSYQITLPSEKKYGFQAQKDGFYAISDNLDLMGLGRYGEVVKNLYMHPIEKNELIRLNNVFFDVNKSDLRKESNAELNRLIVFLNRNTTIKIKIEGHTDNQGNAPYNLKLSNDRAKSVMDYLIENGIDAGRLSSEGFGLTKPIADNNTDEGKQKNRRVEFRIVEK